MAAICETLAEVKAGKFLTEEQTNKRTKEWLGK
jgi:hypothetical protein